MQRFARRLTVKTHPNDAIVQPVAKCKRNITLSISNLLLYVQRGTPKLASGVPGSLQPQPKYGCITRQISCCSYKSKQCDTTKVIQAYFTPRALRPQTTLRQETVTRLYSDNAADKLRAQNSPVVMYVVMILGGFYYTVERPQQHSIFVLTIRNLKQQRRR